MPYTSYSDKIIGIFVLITFITYVSLVSAERYVNKNSSQWSSTSLDDKKYVGYTNMVGSLFMIFVCAFDGIIFINAKKIYLNIYIIKLLILIIFIVFSYDTVIDNTPYSKFISSLQPLVGYLQVLCIGTIVQIITRINKKLNKSIITDDLSEISRRDRSESDIGRLLEKSDE
jgi:phage-related holin